MELKKYWIERVVDLNGGCGKFKVGNPLVFQLSARLNGPYG